MIIECNKCNKKFNVDESLIPENGRLLKCSNCEIQFVVENNNETNQAVSRKPVKITESTTFSTGNEIFTIQPDKNGYTMMSKIDGKEKMYGKIRKMPDREFYILAKENENSFGYFDNDGNFIVESYDPDSDSVYLKKYNLE